MNISSTSMKNFSEYVKRIQRFGLRVLHFSSTGSLHDDCSKNMLIRSFKIRDTVAYEWPFQP